MSLKDFSANFFAKPVCCCSHTREIMGNIKDLQHLTQNCQNLVHKFYGSHFEILPKEFFPTSYKYLNHNTSHFGGYWHRLEN